MKVIHNIKAGLCTAILSSAAVIFLSGCIYAHNKSWSDMTPAEQETVQQAYDSIKSSLDEAFPPDSPEGEGLIVIRYYLALRGAENGVTAMVTPFFCVQG